jgi:hypothetical protein
VLAGAALGAGERVADDAFDAEGGVGGDLGGDLVDGVLAQDAAGADVGAFGAFPHDDHVDLAVAGQRTAHTGVELRRAQVHVVVELEAQPQEEAALEDAAGHRRVADGAEEDRVVLLELGQHRLGEELPGGVPARRAQVVVRGLDARRHLVEDLERLIDDLRSDSVARDDRKAHPAPSLLHHVSRLGTTRRTLPAAAERTLASSPDRGRPVG